MMMAVRSVRDGLKNIWVSAMSLLAGLLLWQYCLSGDDFSLMPPPSAIFSALQDLIGSGELWLHATASIKRLVPGWISGVCIGWFTGVLIGTSMTAFRLITPWLVLLFPVPKIALFPAFILFFGIGESARISIIFMGVFFPVVYCVWQSVLSVPASFVDMGKSFGLSSFSIVWRIIIPGSLPGLFLSCRLTIAIALILLLAAEMLGANDGLGAFIVGAGSMAMMDKLFAGVTVLSLFSLFMFCMLGLLEKYYVHWRGSVCL
ncbi:MAG: ABC transporter permease [Candidatus Endonucleobacter bathymodioli]|uniref:ABC transporter permease n=1 Tax=Candidatus Endonucleibacter bathymodioli TaxID=539814 RepID=A0AA90SSU6_9GAMM|nr:ABC transporter permease [Candidatus Endonucleobacter bathymodioli]